MVIAMLTVAHVAVAQDVIITYKGGDVKLKQSLKDSITINTEKTNICIDSRYQTKEIVILMQGKCDNGTVKLTSAGKAVIELNGLSLNSNEGAPLVIKNKKRVKISAKSGSYNELSIAACQDTANHKAAVVWAKGNIHFSGKGSLNINAIGDGCKGICSKKNIEIKNLTLNVITHGNNLGKKENSGFGGFGVTMGPPPDFNFDELPDSIKAFIEEMRKKAPMGPPTFGAAPGGMPFGGPDMGFGGPSGDPDETIKGAFKQKYISTTKAIKADGTVTIDSGHITCKTSSQGAEGIEGKKGITINGGDVTVDAIDDAINANAQINFNGGKVIAESHCNDAVDSNMPGGFFMPFGTHEKQEVPKDPAIIITGGEVYAWSHVGSPEEGLDCDFSPIAISGGQVFSIGAGMGDMPSVPTEETAKQPTALLIGINLAKGETLEIYEGEKPIATITMPFTFIGSSSILTHPAFKAGQTYKIQIGDMSRTFTFDKNFITVDCKQKNN